MLVLAWILYVLMIAVPISLLLIWLAKVPNFIPFLAVVRFTMLIKYEWNYLVKSGTSLTISFLISPDMFSTLTKPFGCNPGVFITYGPKLKLVYSHLLSLQYVFLVVFFMYFIKHLSSGCFCGFPIISIWRFRPQ